VNEAHKELQRQEERALEAEELAATLQQQLDALRKAQVSWAQPKEDEHEELMPVVAKLDKGVPKATRSAAPPATISETDRPCAPDAALRAQVEAVLQEAAPALRWAQAELKDLQDDVGITANEELCQELEENNKALQQATWSLQHLQADYNDLIERSVLQEAQFGQEVAKMREDLSRARAQIQSAALHPVVEERPGGTPTSIGSDNGEGARLTDLTTQVTHLTAEVKALGVEIDTKTKLLDDCVQELDTKSKLLDDSEKATQRAKESFYLSLQAEQEAAEEAERILRKRVEQLEVEKVAAQAAARGIEEDLRQQLQQREAELASLDHDRELRPVLSARVQRSAAPPAHEKVSSQATTPPEKSKRPASLPPAVYQPRSPAQASRGAPVLLQNKSPVLLQNKSPQPQRASPEPKTLVVKPSAAARAQRGAAPPVPSLGNATRGRASILSPSLIQAPIRIASPSLSNSAEVYTEQDEPEMTWAKGVTEDQGLSASSPAGISTGLGEGLEVEAANGADASGRENTPERVSRPAPDCSPKIYSPFVSALDEYISLE
jgi:hypothetical protein